MNGKLWIWLPSSTPHKRYSGLRVEAPKRGRVSALRESTSNNQRTQLNLIGDVTAQSISYEGPRL